jgi:hypothetical protein
MMPCVMALDRLSVLAPNAGCTSDSAASKSLWVTCKGQGRARPAQVRQQDAVLYSTASCRGNTRVVPWLLNQPPAQAACNITTAVITTVQQLHLDVCRGNTRVVPWLLNQPPAQAACNITTAVITTVQQLHLDVALIQWLPCIVSAGGRVAVSQPLCCNMQLRSHTRHACEQPQLTAC